MFQPDSNSEELKRVAKAFLVHSATSYSFAGGPEIDAVDRLQLYPAWQIDTSRSALEIVISRVIYFQAYTRKFDGRAIDLSGNSIVRKDASFADSLSQANDGKARWDRGWQVYSLGLDGDLQIKKDGVHQFPAAGEYLFDCGPRMRPQPGDFVQLRVHSESSQFQNGYYFCFGDTLCDEFDDHDKVRFYFNIEPRHAAPLIESLTRRLNRFRVPFRFKCPSLEENYDRIDTAVLYVASRFARIAAEVVIEAADTCLRDIEDAIPLFSRRFVPGVGFAEDSSEGRSFGELRCSLVAAGIMAAWKEHVSESNGNGPSVDKLLSSIRDEFGAQGFDFEQPWLRARSRTDYEWLDDVAAQTQRELS